MCSNSIVIMWSLVLKQLKFNLEIYKMITESQLRIVNKELENIEWDMKRNDSYKMST
jgi:hypothetical protein